MNEEKPDTKKVLKHSVYSDNPESVHSYSINNTKVSESYQNEVLANWNLPAGSQVLDVGAGSGAQIDFLKHMGYEVFQTELSPSAFNLQKEIGIEVPGAIADGTRLPYASRKFEGVHCKDVIIHIENREAFFKEAFRLLKPGGELIVTFYYLSHGMFVVRSRSPEGREKSSQILVSSNADYVRKIAQYERRKSELQEVSPPYFQTEPTEIDRNAQRAGFVVLSKKNTTWMPKDDDSDWTGIPRIVRFYQKPKK